MASKQCPTTKLQGQCLRASGSVNCYAPHGLLASARRRGHGALGLLEGVSRAQRREGGEVSFSGDMGEVRTP